MITNKPLCGWDIRKDIWVHLQESAAVLPVFHFPAHKVLTFPGHQETATLAWVHTLATDPAVDSADDHKEKVGTVVSGGKAFCQG